MAVIGGFRSDLSPARKTDGNFRNFSAGVLFSKVAYQGTVVNIVNCKTNKYLSQFLNWLVSIFSVMVSLICEYTDAMSIERVSKLLQNFLLMFRLSS